ncbi:MAG TPA: PEGA domain-containing protein [Terriglobales bacterium]|jgi:hypothetical protein|nr:PEGA domain-containing protein [Terriglobales bacterium]
MRRFAWALVAVFVAVALPVPARAKDPKPEDFPATVKVISSQQAPYMVQSGGGDSSTDCHEYGSDVKCTTTDSSTTWRHVYVTIKVQVTAADATKEYVIGCDRAFRWSKCLPLEPGLFHAKWSNKGLDVLFRGQDGKWHDHTYSILSSSVVEAPLPVPSQPAGQATTAPSPETAPATVSVDSTPRGAEIYVDGDFVGSAPSMLKLAPGKHSIRLTAKGYADWTRELSVLAGSSVNLAATLEKQP